MIKFIKSRGCVVPLINNNELGGFGKFRVFRHEFTDYNQVQKENQDKYMDVANALVDLTIKFAPELKDQAEKWFKDKLILTLNQER